MPEKNFDSIYKGFLRDYPWLGAGLDGEHPLAELPRFKRTVEFLYRYAPPASRVLDLGAWPGTLSGCLNRMGWVVTAVDKNAERSTKWARIDLLDATWMSSKKDQNILSVADLCEGEKINYYSLDIETEPLPLDSESVDAVILTEVIEHLYHDPLFVLSEINRVLRANSGILILSTPNLLSFRNRVNFMLGNIDRVLENPFVSFLKQQRLGHLGHLRMYSAKELAIMLRLLGFASEFFYDRIVYESAPKELLPVAGQSDSVFGRDQSIQTVKKSQYLQSPLVRFVGKFLKSPKNYCNAVGATITEIVEKAIPAYAPQMFVVAKKVTNPDFERNYLSEVTKLIRENT